MIALNETINIIDLDDDMIKTIERIESILDRELLITSGYRSPNHPIEKAKSKPGEHSTGLAVDVACANPSQFYDLVEAAIEVGVKRIGISRKNGFVHLGLDNSRSGRTIWTY